MGLTPSTLARLLIRDSISGIKSPFLASRAPISTQADVTNTVEGSSSRVIGPPLTPRDAAVLSKIAEVQTNQRISHTLGVSLETIKKDLDPILRNLSASDRTHAVAMAIKQGHIRPET